MSIFLAIVVLSFLVFFHELGHFVVARICGVKVEVFSIGFGQKLVSVRLGQTQYALSLIPLGGYVKLKGQDDTNPSLKNLDSDSYLAKSPLLRIAILLAGPFFNFILAFGLYVAVGVGGKPSLLPVVGEVRADLPAHLAGIQPNDRIISASGQPTRTWAELDSLIQASEGALELEVLRGSQNLFIVLSPVMSESSNIFGERIQRRVIGIVSKNEVGEVAYSGWESIKYGLDETLKASLLIVQGVSKLISGALPSSEVGGVVSMVSVIGTASQDSFATLLWLTALISVNLGVLNLLPIPALDGGHIIFNLYELIRRKAPNEQVMYYLSVCGWAVLLSLMCLGLYNDIFRLIS